MPFEPNASTPSAASLGAAPHRRIGVRLLDRALLGILRVLSGRRAARLALRFGWRIYRSGSRSDARNRSRFILRSAYYRSTTKTWFARLNADPMLRTFVRLQPELAEKLHRPYARADHPATTRLQALDEHYRICREQRWAPLLAQVGRGPVTLATWQGKDEVPLVLTLTVPGQFAKEGEMAVHLMRNDVRQCTVLVSLRGDGSGRWLDIACLQGPAGGEGGEGRDAMREITKACHGLRPRSLLLEVARLIAGLAGCSNIVGVGNARHIYRNARKRRDIAFDYDAFWAESGGERRNDGDWNLPLAAAVKPMEDVPSKKRAEVVRRRQMQAAILAQASHCLAPSAG
ncbi:VirK/YbjX family protein [Niveibacterium umoris]|uniref:DUF535 domain-containing protein n=1 Tax=Niveibacterium umoris TaxID=1193620 RepID=A0A840BGH2_9RHOO|nr:DUF535 family protein [Niveibacterium umoris]MBB4012275.1 hypothetical protein [Niveibacterium umoris]